MPIQAEKVKTRRRDFGPQMTAEEAEAKAKALSASAQMMPVGNARTEVLLEANRLKTYAEMKRTFGANS